MLASYADRWELDGTAEFLEPTARKAAGTGGLVPVYSQRYINQFIVTEDVKYQNTYIKHVCSMAWERFVLEALLACLFA